MEQNDDNTYKAQLFEHWKLLQQLAQNRFKNTVLPDVQLYQVELEAAQLSS
jgi:hypothetical protein